MELEAQVNLNKLKVFNSKSLHIFRAHYNLDVMINQ